MKNGVIAGILAAMLSLPLVGCGSKQIEEIKNESQKSMFVEVEWTGSWRVVYQKDTKVMYVVSYGAHNNGVFTVLLNPDGTPMLWEG